MKFGNTTIGGMSFGSTKIGGAKYGNTLVFQPGGEVHPGWIPYIRGGADGSYIDTGITPDSTMRVIIWARNFNPGISPNTMLFGSREETVETNSIQFMSGVTNNTGKMFARFGDGTPYWTNNDFGCFGHYHKYELRPDGIYVDDSLKISVSVPATMSNNYNLFLFACNNAGVRSGNLDLPIDICACQIYKGGVLVRDYTAVKSPSVGLYDSVSQTLFTNAGSGKFSFGSFNPDAYMPLQYITTGGSSYILTDVDGTYSVPIIVKFHSTLSTASWSNILGSRDSTNRCEIYVGNTSKVNAFLYGILGTGSGKNIYDSGGVANALNKDVIVVKDKNVFNAYYNNAKLGTGYTGTTTQSFTTSVPLILGGLNYSGFLHPFYGRIHYARIGGYNFVPAKVNDVAGMYDTYSDIFFPSSSSTPFTAGPTI